MPCQAFKAINEDDTQAMKKSIKKQYFVVCVGCTFVLAGYGAVLGLQSSINIEGGLGAAATTINFFTSLFVCLFFVPFALRIIGVKKTLILSEFAYTFYVVANFYPKKWLLILSGVVAGWAGAFFWVPLAFLFLFFGKWYSHFSKKEDEACVKEFSGILFAILCWNGIIGNSISFGIFQFLKISQSDQLGANTSQTSWHFEGNATEVFRSLEYCGANDCQDANVTQENINRYVPDNKTPIYIILVSLLTIALAGIFLNIRSIPDIPLDFDEYFAIPKTDDKTSDTNGDVLEGTFCSKVISSSWMTLKDTLSHFLSVNQMLILIPATYFGLLFGFIYSDVTRAYVSCVQGVEMVPLNYLILASTSFISSYVCGIAASRFGKTPLLFVAAAIDLCTFLTCLLWLPTEETAWAIHLLFVGTGVSGGCWQISVANLYADYFSGNYEVYYTFWNVYWSLGFGLQFAWSSLLCVRVKTYIMIGALFTTVVVAGILVWRKKSREPKELI